LPTTPASTTLAWQANAPAARKRPGAGATEVAVTQHQDKHSEDDGLLRFIADRATRAEAEDLAFEHGGADDVFPHADGRGLTVEFGDNTRRSWRWQEG
jgi:hypothetical protein